MPNNTYYVSIHCLPADIGQIIILLILVVLVILVCLHHRLFVVRLLLPLLLLLLVAQAIIGDGNCLHYFWHLDIDRATGFDLGQPRLALGRPGNVSILVVHLRPVASRVVGVPLIGFIGQ